MKDNQSEMERRVQALADQQNLARGVLARLESNKINVSKGAALGKVERQRQAQERRLKDVLAFRSGVQRCLLHARAQLAEEDFGPYLKWLNDQLHRVRLRYESTPIGFDYLAGVHTSPRVPLAKELHWISARLSLEQAMISEFRRLADQVDRYACLGDSVGALSKLAEIVSVYGESMWSVELRIGLEQYFQGLDRQKRYYEAVRLQHKRGLLAYVAYNVTVRNEAKTTLSRFQSQASARIEGRPGFIRPYLRYRLLAEWPNTDRGLARVLQVEQSNSPLDVYETFVALGQESLRNPEYAHIRGHIEELKADSESLSKIPAAWEDDVPGKLRIVIGPVASGSAVLADGQVVSEIREHNRDLCGIEMEVYGLYAAARAASSPRPTAFALKSVCDFADPDKDDKYQRYAAYTSARVMGLLFEKYGSRLLASQ